METVVKIENFTGNELIVREGNALDNHYPNKIDIKGDIRSISSFLDVRYKHDFSLGVQKVDINKAIVEVDNNNLSIKLLLDPENPFGAKITGLLEESDELKPFNINKPVTFTKEQFVKLLRFSRILFSDPDKYNQILSAYQTFSAKAYIDLQQEIADQKGNRSNNFKKTVETNIPSDFIMTAPIYKGQHKETFRVDIWLDVTEGSAKFWFESVELHELMQSRRDEIFSN